MRRLSGFTILAVGLFIFSTDVAFSAALFGRGKNNHARQQPKGLSHQACQSRSIVDGIQDLDPNGGNNQRTSAIALGQTGKLDVSRRFKIDDQHGHQGPNIAQEPRLRVFNWPAELGREPRFDDNGNLIIQPVAPVRDGSGSPVAGGTVYVGIEASDPACPHGQTARATFPILIGQAGADQIAPALTTEGGFASQAPASAGVNFLSDASSREAGLEAQGHSDR